VTEKWPKRVMPKDKKTTNSTEIIALMAVLYSHCHMR